MYNVHIYWYKLKTFVAMKPYKSKEADSSKKMHKLPIGAVTKSIGQKITPARRTTDLLLI